MTVLRARLDKGALLAMPPEQRWLFFAVAHLMNELSTLLRGVAWSREDPSQSDDHYKAQLATSMFFARLLAGKLSEAWILLQKHFLSKPLLHELFSKTATSDHLDALNALKKYFGKAQLLNAVRNDFAFHYSPTALDEVLPGMSDDLELFTDRVGRCNTLYYFAEAAVNHAMLQRIAADDRLVALTKLYNELFAVTGNFLSFGQGFMCAVVAACGPGIWHNRAEDIELGPLPEFLQTRFPWFVQPPQ